MPTTDSRSVSNLSRAYPDRRPIPLSPRLNVLLLPLAQRRCCCQHCRGTYRDAQFRHTDPRVEWLTRKCAARLGGGYIFSWKPNPSMLVGRFDAGRIEAYIRRVIDVARANGCVLEIILKDTHTCENHPERFDQWTRIARRLVEEA